jgi:hypothetical protein
MMHKEFKEEKGHESKDLRREITLWMKRPSLSFCLRYYLVNS